MAITLRPDEHQLTKINELKTATNESTANKAILKSVELYPFHTRKIEKLENELLVVKRKYNELLNAVNDEREAKARLSLLLDDAEELDDWR